MLLSYFPRYNCQSVDTFGFEISSFVTVLLHFEMFKMFLDAIFLLKCF